jgi:hypothetical protein
LYVKADGIMFGFVKRRNVCFAERSSNGVLVKRQAFLTRCVKWDSVSNVLELSVFVVMNRLILLLNQEKFDTKREDPKWMEMKTGRGLDEMSILSRCSRRWCIRWVEIIVVCLLYVECGMWVSLSEERQEQNEVAREKEPF